MAIPRPSLTFGAHSRVYLLCALGYAVAVPFADVGEATGWVRTVTNNLSAEVTFTVSVRQSNMEELRRIALAVSTPGDPAYGKYLAQREIDELTAPAPTDLAVVTTWLAKAGIAFVVDREQVVVKTSVAAAQRLLSTTFYEYRAAESPVLLRASAYHLPDAVAAVTSATFGLHGLPLPHGAKVHVYGAKGMSEHVKVTPAVIAETYHMQGATVDRQSGNRQAVAEFQNQDMNKADLSLFFQNEVGFAPTHQPWRRHFAHHQT